MARAGRMAHHHRANRGERVSEVDVVHHHQSLLDARRLAHASPPGRVDNRLTIRGSITHLSAALFRDSPTTFVIDCSVERWNDLRSESFKNRSVIGGEQEGTDPIFNVGLRSARG